MASLYNYIMRVTELFEVPMTTPIGCNFPSCVNSFLNRVFSGNQALSICFTRIDCNNIISSNSHLLKCGWNGTKVGNWSLLSSCLTHLSILFGRGWSCESPYNAYWTSVGSTRDGLLKLLQAFLSSASKYCECVKFLYITTFVILGDGDLTLNGALRVGNSHLKAWKCQIPLDMPPAAPPRSKPNIDRRIIHHTTTVENGITGEKEIMSV